MINLFNKRPFLIADIAFNYYEIAKKEDCSNIDAAKLMINEAKGCGIDAINFHIGDLEQIYCSYSDDVDITTFNENKLTVDDYAELFDYCNDLKMRFIATVYDEDIICELDEFIEIYKISSLDLTNIPFIKFLASKNKPLILPTGAATLSEIRQVVKYIEDNFSIRIALLHSILSYPTNFQDANLLMIKDLIENFSDYDVGYCDNTKSDVNLFVLITAFNYGAIILEKYFTLDKSLKGHEFSMDSKDVRIFKKNIELLTMINGYKNKQPLICESNFRRNLRKSIFTKKDIKKGEILTVEHISIGKPGDGISPLKLDEIIGKVAVQDIPKDTMIDYGMFL